MRWQGEKGGRIVRWHSQRGGKVLRWQKGGRRGEMARRERWESSEVASWEILCFIQGWETQGETKIFSQCLPRCVQDILAWLQGMERFPLDVTQAVRNVAGCRSVWNS